MELVKRNQKVGFYIIIYEEINMTMAESISAWNLFVS